VQDIHESFGRISVLAWLHWFE